MSEFRGIWLDSELLLNDELSLIEKLFCLKLAILRRRRGALPVMGALPEYLTSQKPDAARLLPAWWGKTISGVIMNMTTKAGRKERSR